MTDGPNPQPLAENDAPLFITVHDADVSKRRWPDGKPVRVRADSIDTLRPYPDGRTRRGSALVAVRTVVGIRGSYLHVTEPEDVILRLLGARPIPPGAGALTEREVDR